MHLNVKRITAVMCMAAILVSLTAAPVMAKNGPEKNSCDQGKVKAKMYERFKDLGGYEWGLTDVTKIVGKGLFRGKGLFIFAPGAKITQQEAAIVALRLIGKESTTETLTKDEVDHLLKDIPDQEKIAAWARAAVAQMVKLGIVSSEQKFHPTEPATRLDVAVLLVKALGYEHEAQEAMNKPLSFRDADKIPAALRGYVYIATDLHLISGYAENGHGDRTFRPYQAVKRIEAAIMMARADNLIDRHQADEIRGIVKSVNTHQETMIVTKSNGNDVVLTLADDAVILVDNQEENFKHVTAGMSVLVKLDSAGKIIYIEANTVHTKSTTITGVISALTFPTTTSLGVITVKGTAYTIPASAVVTINNTAAALADLQVNDTVVLSLSYGQVTKVRVTRTVVEGSLTAMQAPTSGSLGLLTIGTTVYPVVSGAVITVNGSFTSFTDLKLGDRVSLTLLNGRAIKVSAIR